jgi:hypothetical protein
MMRGCFSDTRKPQIDSTPTFREVPWRKGIINRYHRPIFAIAARPSRCAGETMTRVAALILRSDAFKFPRWRGLKGDSVILQGAQRDNPRHTSCSFCPPNVDVCIPTQLTIMPASDNEDCITQGGTRMASAARMIRQDHKKVANLFKKFDHARTSAAKKRIVNKVVKALDLHARLEEEIFYPAVRKQLGEEEMLEEAYDEHRQATEIMRALKAMDGDDERLDLKFSELIECVQHHVEEEEGELLPMVEQSSMDLALYGEQMSERKEDLTESSRVEELEARQIERLKPERAHRASPLAPVRRHR